MTDPRQSVRPQRSPQGYDRAERERILARRRLALIVLIALVPVTLVAAIITGSMVLLIVNLVADLLIAVYVAMLLQIKQTQGMSPRHGMSQPDEDVRVVR